CHVTLVECHSPRPAQSSPELSQRSSNRQTIIRHCAVEGDTISWQDNRLIGAGVHYRRLIVVGNYRRIHREVYFGGGGKLSVVPAQLQNVVPRRTRRGEAVRRTWTAEDHHSRTAQQRPGTGQRCAYGFAIIGH